MKRFVVVPISVLCLAACASVPPPTLPVEAAPPAPADKLFSDNFFAQCLTDFIAVADDHHSDVSTIALAVQHMCLANFDTVVLMNARSLSDDEKATFSKQANAAELPTITQMIVRERAIQKQN